MKKLFFWIRAVFMWCCYLHVTREERLKYTIGMNKGMLVVKIEHDALGMVVEYDCNRKPVKNFMDWKEFKEMWVDKCLKMM